MDVCAGLYFIEKGNVDIYDQVGLRGWNLVLIRQSDRF